MSRKRTCDCGTCKLCKNREYDKRRQNDPKRRAYRTEYQRKYMRTRREQNPEIREFDREVARRWYQVNGNADVVRVRDLKRNYGLTPADVVAMIETQQYVCAICGEPFGEEHARRPVVDHDPRIGRKPEAVRGILHQECNRQLGYIERWREILVDALQYADKAIERLRQQSV